MNMATDMKRVMARVQEAEPSERLQSLTFFPSGKVTANFVSHIATFDSTAELDALVEYLDRREAMAKSAAAPAPALVATALAVLFLLFHVERCSAQLPPTPIQITHAVKVSKPLAQSPKGAEQAMSQIVIPPPSPVFTNNVAIGIAPKGTACNCVIQRATNASSLVWVDLFAFAGTNSITNWQDTNAPSSAYYRISNYAPGLHCANTNQ